MKQYEVTGMSCAACSARVEKAVSKVPGGLPAHAGTSCPAADEAALPVQCKAGRRSTHPGRRHPVRQAWHDQPVRGGYADPGHHLPRRVRRQSDRRAHPLDALRQ